MVLDGKIMVGRNNDDEDDRRPDRLWRMEQRQGEILSRLERIQIRLDELAQRIDGHNWRSENAMTSMSAQMGELSKRPTGPGLLGEMTPMIKMVLGALLALIATLAFGKAFVWPG